MLVFLEDTENPSTLIGAEQHPALIIKVFYHSRKGGSEGSQAFHLSGRLCGFCGLRRLFWYLKFSSRSSVMCEAVACCANIMRRRANRVSIPLKPNPQVSREPRALTWNFSSWRTTAWRHAGGPATSGGPMGAPGGCRRSGSNSAWHERPAHICPKRQM